MTSELEINVLETEEHFVAYLPPYENGGVEGGLVFSAAYKSKRHPEDHPSLLQLPDTAELVKTVFTGYRVGDDCFDNVIGETYKRLEDGSWLNDEHLSFRTSFPNVFKPSTLEARTFEALVQAAKPVKIKN